MANEVKTVFTADAVELFRTADRVEQRLKSLNTNLGNASNALTVRPPSVSNTLQTQNATPRIMSVSVTAMTVTRLSVASVAGSLPGSAATPRPASPASSTPTSRGDISNAAEGLVGGAILSSGIAATIQAGKEAIAVAIEHERVNRQLAGSAVQAGVSFTFASEKNAQFAQQMGVARDQAIELTSSVLQLSANAGQLKQLDQVFKSISDLGASRGLSNNQVSGIISSVSEGNIDAIKQLGVSDLPQKMRDYAKSIGVTTEELTKYERAEIAVKAIREESANVAGASELKLNSLGGTISKAAAAWGDFTTNASVAFSQSPIITDGINTLAAAFGSLAVKIDEVNKKLKEGKSPEEVAKELGGGVSAGDYARAGATAFIFGGLLPKLFGGENAVDPSKVHEDRLRGLADQVRAEQGLNEVRDAAAAKNAAADEAEKQRTIDARNERKSLTTAFKEYNDVLGDSKTSMSELLRIQTEAQNIRPSSNLEDAAKFEEQRLDVLKRVNKAIAEDVQKATNQVKELGKSYISAFESIPVEPGNEFLKLTRDLAKAQEDFAEKTKGLTPELIKQGQAMLQVNAENAKFKLRVDSAFEAQDLRRRAADIRSGGSQAGKPETDEEYRRRLQSGVTLAYDRGAFGLRRSPDEGPLAFTPQQAQQVYGDYLASQAYNDPRLTGINQRTVASGAYELVKQRTEDNLPAQARLDQQINLANQLGRGAQNDEQRAITDARIAGLSQGINPAELRGDQREAIATALENQAKRAEEREKNAEKLRNDQLETNQKVRNFIDGLEQKAKEGGTEAVKTQVNLNIQNSSGKPVTGRANPNDVTITQN